MKTTSLVACVWMMLAGPVTCLRAAEAPSQATARPAAEPIARLEPAPAYKFPAAPDCNSPCFWSEGELRLFTSNQHPSVSSGPDLEHLGKPASCVFEDGAYVFFANDLSNPASFTPPRKIKDGGGWYVQVIGDKEIQGTDTLAGQSARFFQSGTSNFRIVFERPQASTPNSR